MHHPFLRSAAALLASGLVLSAQTTVIYTTSQNDPTARTTTSANPLIFQLPDYYVYATVSGVISGDGSLTKTGAGRLTLTAANTYSGPTLISAGEIWMENASALGTGAVTVAAGATLNSRSYAFDLTRLSGSGSVYSSGGFTFNSASNYSVSTALRDTASLAKSGEGTLTLTGANTYSGGTTISAGTLQIGGGGTTGSLSGNITDNAMLVFDRSDATSYSGVISGSGSLTKRGASTLTLNNANTYSGVTTISAGTLQIGSGGTTGSIVGNVTNNATLAFNRSDAVTYAGVISGSGSVNKLGANTLTLSADQTYTGGTTISSGTLQIGDSGTALSDTGAVTVDGGKFALGAANETIGSLFGTGGRIELFNGSGRTLTITQSSDGTFAGIIQGSGGALNKASSGTLTLTGANTYSGGTTISAGILQIGDGGSIGSIIGNVTNNATLAFNRYNATTFSGVISGSGSVVKTGFGTLTLSGTNTHSGGTTINAGLINFTSADNLGSGQITLNGGGLQWATGNTTDISTQLTALGTNGATFDTNGNNVTLASGLSGSGSVNKSGSGTLTLSGVNTYSGGTVLTEGVLALGSPDAIGTTGLIYFPGGTLQFSAANTTDYSSRFYSAGFQAYSFDTNGQTVTLASTFGDYSKFIDKMGAGTLILRGDTLADAYIDNFGGTLQINDGGTFGTPLDIRNEAILAFNRSDTVTLATRIYGDGSVTQSGTGTLLLTGANTYTGGTTVEHGVLSVAAADSLGTGNIVIGADGTLDVGNNVYELSRISGSGHLLATQTLVFADNSDASLAVAIAGSTALAKSGTGTSTLNGASTYSGGTDLRAGILALGHNQALGTGTLTLNGGGLSADGAARTIANAVIFNSDTTVSGSHRLTVTGNFTLARNRDLTIDTGATLALSGVVSQSGGTRALLKYGTGTLELNGANTYTGGTLIAEGAVRINNLTGSAFGTGAVTVEAGATLTGAGSFTGALQLNGTYSPGNSPGRSATGSQTWNGGANYIWEINDASGTAGTSYDLLSISGTLTINATPSDKFTLSLVSLLADNSAGNVINFNTTFGSAYTIATTTGGILGFDANAFTIDSTGFTNGLAGGTWSLALTNSNRDLQINFTATAQGSAIPEPATYATLFGAAALGLAFVRRRRVRDRRVC